MNASERISILDVNVSAVNMQGALNTIAGWIERNERRYVCVTGVHGVMECQGDEELRRIHNESGMTVPDGMPLVWGGRLQGAREMGRVYGPDLMLEVFGLSRQKGYSHFLYGGKEGVAERLAENLEQMFPGVRIAGTYAPPFRPLNDLEASELIEQVEKARPDVFWVGLSTPKQERFMAGYLDRLDTKVMIGVGAAFDIHTGSIKDAPDILKKTGLQWAHRLYQEPRRLWRRYLTNNPRFVCLFLKQLITNRIV